MAIVNKVFAKPAAPKPVPVTTNPYQRNMPVPPAAKQAVAKPQPPVLRTPQPKDQVEKLPIANPGVMPPGDGVGPMPRPGFSPQPAMPPGDGVGPMPQFPGMGGSLPGMGRLPGGPPGMGGTGLPGVPQVPPGMQGLGLAAMQQILAGKAAGGGFPPPGMGGFGGYPQPGMGGFGGYPQPGMGGFGGYPQPGMGGFPPPGMGGLGGGPYPMPQGGFPPGMGQPPGMAANPYQRPTYMDNPEFQGYQKQADDLNRQMDEYMKKAPMYQQLQDLQGKMRGFEPQQSPGGARLDQAVQESLRRGEFNPNVAMPYNPDFGNPSMAMPYNPMTSEIGVGVNPNGPRLTQDQMMQNFQQAGLTNQYNGQPAQQAKYAGPMNQNMFANLQQTPINQQTNQPGQQQFMQQQAQQAQNQYAQAQNQYNQQQTANPYSRPMQTAQPMQQAQQAPQPTYNQAPTPTFNQPAQQQPNQQAMQSGMQQQQPNQQATQSGMQQQQPQQNSGSTGKTGLF